MNTVIYDVNMAPWDYGQMLLYAGLILVGILIPILVRFVVRQQPGERRPRAYWAFGAIGLLLVVVSIAGIVQCTTRAQRCLDARADGKATAFSGSITSVTLVRRSSSSKARPEQQIEIGDKQFISAFDDDMSECGFKQSFSMTTDPQVGARVTGLASGTTILLMVHVQ